MDQTSDQLNLPDIYAPTLDELVAISNGVFLSKRKSANVVTSSFHKWERVWEDNLTLRVVGENEKNLYRALAFSIPLHLGGPGDDRSENIYSGFVAAIAKLGNDTRILPMNKVSWSNAPLSDLASDDADK